MEKGWRKRKLGEDERAGEGKGRGKARNAEIKVKCLGKKRGAGKRWKGRGEKFSLSLFFWNTFGRFGRSIGETIVARRTLRDCWTDIFVFPSGLFFFFFYDSIFKRETSSFYSAHALSQWQRNLLIVNE